MKLIDLVESVARQLAAAGVSFGHGTLDAFDEAAWLVLWRLGIALDALDDHAQQVCDAASVAAVRELVVKRITTRVPTAYLTGEAWLQGLPFHVDRRCIVPRSLIAEVLFDDALEAWLPAAPARVLDLCTGNGSLAVLAALAWPDTQVDAADLSADALEVANSNVQRHRLASRIRLRQGDGLEAADGCYDLVLCNPPYVHHAAMARLPPEYRAEPALALDGGVDGMDFVRRLIPAVAQHLQRDGVLVLEIGHERTHFTTAFPQLQPVWLDTSVGDDQVLLLSRAALGPRADKVVLSSSA